MKNYTKKPVTIEAIQWTGGNLIDIINFAESSVTVKWASGNDELLIHTLEGNMIASKYDYIIKGIDGEFYPCKPSIFERTYDINKPSELLSSVIDDLKSREDRGRGKYNTTMDRTDLTHNEWLQHAYEEALDMALYLKKAMEGSKESKKSDHERGHYTC